MAEDTHDGCVSSCSVVACANHRCKTIVEGNSMTSNVTGRKYNVVSTNDTMSCATKNVI